MDNIFVKQPFTARHVRFTKKMGFGSLGNIKQVIVGGVKVHVHIIARGYDTRARQKTSAPATHIISTRCSGMQLPPLIPAVGNIIPV